MVPVPHEGVIGSLAIKFKIQIPRPPSRLSLFLFVRLCPFLYYKFYIYPSTPPCSTGWANKRKGTARSVLFAFKSKKRRLY